MHLLERLAFMHRRRVEVGAMLINFFHRSEARGSAGYHRSCWTCWKGWNRHIVFAEHG